MGSGRRESSKCLGEAALEDFNGVIDLEAEDQIRNLEFEVTQGGKHSKTRKAEGSWLLIAKRAAACKPAVAKPELAPGLADKDDLSDEAGAERPAIRHSRNVSATNLPDGPITFMHPRLNTNNGTKGKSRKSKKKRESKKHSKSRNCSSYSGSASESAEAPHKGKRRRSSSAPNFSDMFSVFRGASENPMCNTLNSLKSRSRHHPGRMATDFLQRVAHQVGRDAIAHEWSSREMPSCAQAYCKRLLTSDGSGGIAATRNGTEGNPKHCT